MRESNRFTYRADIDWIELEVETVIPTNFATIKRFADVSYVKAVDSGLGGSATIFRFRVYDFNTWSSLEDKIINLNFDKQLVGEPKIVAVEVSFDAKSMTGSAIDLIEHTAESVRMLSNPLASAKNIRAAGSFKGSAEQLCLKKEKNIQVLRKSFYFGSQKDDDVSMRIYWKHTDRNKELPIDEQVSRVEVTLKNGSCPFNTIDEAKTYQFSKLSKFFRFRKVKLGIGSLNQICVDSSSQVSKRGGWKVRTGDNKKKVSYRVYHPFTVSDRELSNKAYESLRQLTKRLNKIRPTRKSRVIHSGKSI